MKKVVILINALPEDASPDEKDVLYQADLVEETLTGMGYVCSRVFMDLDMKTAIRKIQKINPDFVFNLVESIDSSGKLIYLAQAILEHISMPYTGCKLEAMYISSNKILAKSLLSGAGLPTPPWFEGTNSIIHDRDAKYIAKPVWEDASVGIDDGSILQGDKADIQDFINKNRQYRYFFEKFIEGREFNISVIAGPDGPVVLPIAEIVFQNYPDNKPRIVGYHAKWSEGSFEYLNTIRVFGLETDEPELAESLRKWCIRCWKLFGLNGYARVDFRVDKNANPWILEVNANPCLSPDAGFYAAASQAGYNFATVLQHIINDI